MLKRMKMSIFVKLTLMFLIVLFPFYALTLLINQKGAQSISDEVAKSVQSSNQFYIQTLEREIKGIYQLLYEFIIDKDLMMMGISENLKSGDIQDKLKAVQKRLQMVKASSVFVEESKVYLPLMNRMITTSGAPEYDKSHDPDEVDRLSQNVDPGRLIQLADGRLFLSLRYPVVASFDREPLYVVSVEISTVRLMESLRNVVSPEQGNFVLEQSAENWVISDIQDENLLNQLKALSDSDKVKGTPSSAGPIVNDKTRYWASYATSIPLNLTLSIYVPDEKVLGSLRSYERWVWILLAVSIVVVLLFAISLHRIINYPLRKLVSAFRKVEQGRFVPVKGKATKDEFHYLFEGFNRMINQLNLLIHEGYEKDIRIQRSELKRLQTQINPHFLYNCFFIMGGLLSDKDYGRAYAFFQYLRDYYQFITRNAEDHIPLIEEIKHSQTYVDIQTICYGERIDVEFEPLPDDVGTILVPRLIIQPLIENSYKYALNYAQGGLWIHYKVQGEYFCIMVEDNGTKLDDAQISTLSSQLLDAPAKWEESTGLINVHRRLQIMFGKGCGLTLSRSQLGGLCVTITIK